MSGWAVCPVCHAVVGDAVAHSRYHAQVAAWDAPTGTTTAGDHWPADLAVPVPAVPTVTEAATLATVRQAAADTIAQIDADVLPALDAYLALPAPTQAQALAQVRVQALILRGLAILAKRLIRLTVRRLDSTD